MKVFLIDDEKAMRSSLEQWLLLSDFQVTSFEKAELALKQIDTDFEGILISDVKMSGMDGMALLDAVIKLDEEIPVILITGHGDVPMAVQAMKNKAFDFLEKPFSPERLSEIARHAVTQRKLVLENRSLKKRLSQASGLSNYMIGESAIMENLRADLIHFASANVNVMVLGETGTGKELAARTLHDLSNRTEKPFQTVNCGAIPRDLFESEFFGHKKGAYTGAERERQGAFEVAEGGSLFLDELTSMPFDMQVKLLRALETKSIKKLGSHVEIYFDVRVISAANEPVAKAVKEGRFREDLYYRLNTIELTIPPLRERGGDILLLFQHFVHLAEKQFQCQAPKVDGKVHAALMAHNWPGNVRELKNIAERFTLARMASQADIATLLNYSSDSASESKSLSREVAEFEKALISQALKKHAGNIQAVLHDLSLPRRTLNDKMQRYNLSR